MRTSILFVLLIIGLSSIALADTSVTGGTCNSAPSVDLTVTSPNNFKIFGSTPVDFSYIVTISDDNGLDSLDNLQIWYTKSPSTTHSEDFLIPTEDFISYESELIDNCTATLTIKTKTPIASVGTYYFYAILQDQNGGSASDTCNVRVTEVSSLYSVSAIKFPYVKPSQTSTTTFTFTNNYGNPCRITSISFSNLMVSDGSNSDSIPSSAITTTIPDVVIGTGESSTITANFLVPKGTLVGSLSGTCIITLEDVE